MLAAIVPPKYIGTSYGSPPAHSPPLDLSQKGSYLWQVLLYLPVQQNLQNNIKLI